MDYALEHPERVRGLALAAPGLRGYQVTLNPKIEEADRTFATQPERGVSLLLETGMGGVTPQAQAALQHQPTAERLDKIRVPTLVLIGTQDEADLRAIADTLALEVPNASKVVLPHAQHHLNLDRPERFNRELRAFLCALETRRLAGS